ncbi:MAG: PP2C family protein-serine/threonine phosphatase, partial [bacterium]
LFTFIVWYHGAALFYMQNESAFQSGYGLMAFMSFFVVVGLIAIATRDQVSDFDAITPAFVRHITERQRLQGELAVAREVQMSFLPRKNPQISGLEITSKCLPANEIGGDYFDFLELGKNKLGIIVGDVSGKSTQAAFYMTLTKGFLKALVKSIQSPVEMLIQMNNLFFDNVKRGHFISMIYGVFDVEAKTLTLARAGHNPLMVKHAQSGTIKFFDQPGIALGLEKGEIFAQNIKEEVIPFNKDDLFVFYTDGFTEAMNKDKEEFGEQRLLASMADNSSDSARQHLERVFTEVKKFMGKALQQDDMTMVIVKIT